MLNGLVFNLEVCIEEWGQGVSHPGEIEELASGHGLASGGEDSLKDSRRNECDFR
jgi:hypothetical protein